MSGREQTNAAEQADAELTTVVGKALAIGVPTEALIASSESLAASLRE